MGELGELKGASRSKSRVWQDQDHSLARLGVLGLFVGWRLAECVILRNLAAFLNATVFLNQRHYGAHSEGLARRPYLHPGLHAINNARGAVQSFKPKQNACLGRVSRCCRVVAAQGHAVVWVLPGQLEAVLEEVRCIFHHQLRFHSLKICTR